MGTDPPDWEWCQRATPEDKKTFFNITSKSFFVNNQMPPHFTKPSPKNLVEPVVFQDTLRKPKSEYAVCVIPATDCAAKLLRLTGPAIADYARRCGADYIELTGNQNTDWPISNKYRVNQVARLYKKTLYLDCDIVIKPNSPDIFKLTPDDKISAYDEWESWNSIGNTRWILSQQETILHKLLHSEHRDRHLKNGRFCTRSMLNGGVLVIPQELSEYYKQPDVSYPRNWCFDQNYLTLLLPKSKLFNLGYEFNCTYTDQEFFLKERDSYFVHINNLSRNGERRGSIINILTNGDDIDRLILNHIDVSTSKRYDLCDMGIETQKQVNVKLKEFISQQGESEHIIDDVSILCLGHSQIQFESIEDMKYLKKINLNDIDAGAYSGNEWAESRIFLSKDNLFDDGAEFYGVVTASWNFKYQNDAKIENFHNWPSSKILLKSKPEDRLVLCADMFCWCKWIKDESCCYGSRIINSIIDPTTCNNKSIVRKFLDSVGFDRSIHKRVPYSNQIICHKSVYESLVQDIYKHKVPEKIQTIVNGLNRLNTKRNTWEYCHKRVQAYFMELYTIAWLAMSDCKFISNTTRKEDWYDINKMDKRAKQWR